jgi:hypothetical protein
VSEPKNTLTGGFVKTVTAKPLPGTSYSQDTSKKGYFLLVHTEAINDETVLYEYLTSQAIAPAHFYFFGDP